MWHMMLYTIRYDTIEEINVYSCTHIATVASKG